ncbi:hypothetical protein KIPB_005271, partial [Kipferlia bialata]
VSICFLPLHQVSLGMTIPLYTSAVCLYRSLTPLGLGLISLVLYLPMWLVSWDLLGAAIGNIPLGALVEFPMWLLVIPVPAMLDRWLYRKVTSLNPSGLVPYSYLTALLYTVSWFVLQISNPYGATGNPSSMFMHDWSVAHLPMSLVGLYGASFLVMVPLSLLSLYISMVYGVTEQEPSQPDYTSGGTHPSSASSASSLVETAPEVKILRRTRVVRHLQLWILIWAVLTAVGAVLRANFLRDVGIPLEPSESPTAMTIIGITDDYDALGATERAMQHGPDLVMQVEYFESFYADVLEESMAPYMDMAAEYGVWLLLCAGVHYDDNPLKTNDAWLIDDTGAIRLHYQKRHDSFGMEPIFQDPPALPSAVDTPFGRVCISICIDSSFPGTLAACGRDKADIILSPAMDMPGFLSFMSYEMAGRAPENGAVFVRLANTGRSLAVDPFGYQIASYDSTRDPRPNQTVWLTIPTKAGHFTLYPYLAQWLEGALLLSAVAGCVYTALTACTGTRSMKGYSRGLLT